VAQKGRQAQEVVDIPQLGMLVLAGMLVPLDMLVDMLVDMLAGMVKRQALAQVQVQVCMQEAQGSVACGVGDDDVGSVVCGALLIWQTFLYGEHSLPYDVDCWLWTRLSWLPRGYHAWLVSWLYYASDSLFFHGVLLPYVHAVLGGVNVYS